MNRFVNPKCVLLILLGVIGQIGLSDAAAAPILQLYIEGATYDSATETWLIAPSDGSSFRLWAIGNVDGPGGAGTINNVRLSAAYAAGLNLTISLTPVATSPSYEYQGVTIYTDAQQAQYLQTVTDGSSPVLTGGGSLAPHGIYGASTDWQEFLLGDFTNETDTIGDFISTFPTDLSTGGQINVYDVVVSGAFTPTEIHFDLYDSVMAGNHIKAKFAPFSHDGGGTVDEPDGENENGVPEPTTMAIWGLGMAVAAGVTRRSRAKKS